MHNSVQTLGCFSTFLLLLNAPVWAQATPEKRTAPDVFLPFDQERVSEPGVQRVYKQADDKILSPEKQPRGYPKTVDSSYTAKDDEALRIHYGVDYSSRDQKSKAVPLDFKAGVHGTVIDARVGMIKVEVDEIKNRIEYLHNSKTYVSKGDRVKPDDRLGVTGNINPDTGKPVPSMGIHLHVQAKSKNGAALHPDEVISYARKPLSERREAKFFVPLLAKKSIPPFSASDYEGTKANDYYYEVWGTSVKEPSRYRPWSESSDTMQAAQARMEEIRRDHAKGGLLEFDPDGPLKLEIKRTRRSGKPDVGILPGTYVHSFDNGDGSGERKWKLVLSGNGNLKGNLQWGSKNLNVTGIWKFENASLWIQWQGGDFRGTPKWHEEKDYGQWKRISD